MGIVVGSIVHMQKEYLTGASKAGRISAGSFVRVLQCVRGGYKVQRCTVYGVKYKNSTPITISKEAFGECHV